MIRSSQFQLTSALSMSLLLFACGTGVSDNPPAPAVAINVDNPPAPGDAINVKSAPYNAKGDGVTN